MCGCCGLECLWSLLVMLWAVGLDGVWRVADGDASLWRLEGKLRNEKRSLEARSNSFSTLSFPLVSPACPPPPLSPPQCCPLLTLLKATGPIQILYHLEYYSLWDSKRKCGGFTCLSTVSSGWGYVFFFVFFFLCTHPEYKEGESEYSVCLYCTYQCYQ